MAWESFSQSQCKDTKIFLRLQESQCKDTKIFLRLQELETERIAA